MSYLSGYTDAQLVDAKNILGIKFPKDFVDYVKEYGAISFYATEWTGLNVDGYINVVEATRIEKEMNEYFSSDCFAIENIGIDGLISVVNEKGQVFSVQYDKKKLVCENLSEYLDMCIARKK